MYHFAQLVDTLDNCNASSSQAVESTRDDSVVIWLDTDRFFASGDRAEAEPFWDVPCGGTLISLSTPLLRNSASL